MLLYPGYILKLKCAVSDLRDHIRSKDETRLRRFRFHTPLPFSYFTPILVPTRAEAEAEAESRERE